MDFNFDRRTNKLCCAAFIDRKIDHGMYNSFYLDILKVVNTLQLVHDFGERVYERYASFYSCLYIKRKILFRKEFVFKYSVYKMLAKRSFSL